MRPEQAMLHRALSTLGAGSLLLLSGCSNLPLESGWSYGPVTVLKDFFTSSALLDGGDQWALVDAGFHDEGKRLLRGLDERGLRAEDISAIFITHGHEDHLAGLSVFPHATRYALAAEAQRIEEVSGLSPDVLLADGDRISMGDLEIQVYALPGHTEGNAVYRAEEVLLLGDSALFDRDGTVKVPDESYSEDVAQAEASLAELGPRLQAEGSEIRWLVSSHSGPVEGLEPLLSFSPGRD